MELIHHTDAAILIELDTGDDEPIDNVNRFWIPRSVIEDGEDIDDSDYDVVFDIEVKQWFVDNNEELAEAIERANDAEA